MVNSRTDIKGLPRPVVMGDEGLDAIHPWHLISQLDAV